MSSYPIPCPHCDHIADSWDSYGDTRHELDQHKLRKHPDQPDTDHDPRWDVRKAEKR